MRQSKRIAILIGAILIITSIPLIIYGYQKSYDLAVTLEKCDIDRKVIDNRANTSLLINECNIATRDAAVAYQFQMLGEILLIAGIAILVVPSLKRIKKRK